MNYIENIFGCICAPLLIAVFFLRGKIRYMMLFLIAGITMCLLSSYISTFFAAVQGAQLIEAAIEIAPLVEEIMKLMPLLFCIIIFGIDAEDAPNAVLMTAIGFSTFENICYLTQNGGAHLLDLIVRGFGTGAMHIVCGSINAFGITAIWNQKWLRLAGSIALLSVSAVYHGCYNALVSQTGAVAYIGYGIPLVTAAILTNFRLRKKPHSISLSTT